MTDSSEEEILGIFPSFVQKGAGEREWLGFKGVICDLVFTTHKLIIAKDTQRRNNKFLDVRKHYVFSSVSPRERLKMKEQLPENIVRATVEKPEIPYDDIKAAELVKPPLTNWRLCLYTDDLDVPEYTMTISPPNKQWEPYVNQFREFLEYILPGKV